MSKPMRRRKKENKINVKLFLGLVPAIIATVLLVNLVLSMQRGNEQEYMKEVEDVWQQASMLTKEYDSWFTKWKNGELTDAEMIDITKKNIDDMNLLIDRLNNTEPPERLKDAHEFSILSLKYERDSNEEIIKYIETKDEQHLEKSQDLFQNAFEYEGKAFTEFSKAGVGFDRGTVINISE
ncbi:MAG: hypothetical protein D6752_02550 [Candidatus Nitrosothermus koennekii]|nr:MAG: hypothetical protein D6752_02550 [Candidatus Nitrosothermus koennekii]